MTTSRYAMTPSTSYHLMLQEIKSTGPAHQTMDEKIDIKSIHFDYSKNSFVSELKNSPWCCFEENKAESMPDVMDMICCGTCITGDFASERSYWVKEKIADGFYCLMWPTYIASVACETISKIGNTSSCRCCDSDDCICGTMLLPCCMINGICATTLTCAFTIPCCFVPFLEPCYTFTSERSKLFAQISKSIRANDLSTLYHLLSSHKNRLLLEKDLAKEIRELCISVTSDITLKKRAQLFVFTTEIDGNGINEWESNKLIRQLISISSPMADQMILIICELIQLQPHKHDFNSHALHLADDLISKYKDKTLSLSQFEKKVKIINRYIILTDPRINLILRKYTPTVFLLGLFKPSLEHKPTPLENFGKNSIFEPKVLSVIFDFCESKERAYPK